MLTIAELHENDRYDDIYCFADDHATRNKWTGIFRRLGVSPHLRRARAGTCRRVVPLGNVGLNFAQSIIHKELKVCPE